MEIEPALREIVETLAPIERGAGSEGEAQAAALLAERLRAAGCATDVEPVPYHDGYARPVGILCATATLGGLLALSGRLRRTGGLLATGAGLAIADDVSNGPRVVRRRFKPRQTQNVIAVAGDHDAERTLVLLAHHDAAPTGRVFDQTLHHILGERFPGIIERIDTGIPLWWLVLAGPVLTALGALRGRRSQILVGTAGSALATAAFADIASSPFVQGANDNLSSVAVMVALAERLQRTPLRGLRVLLVSCGAEEVIQGGIYGFAERHFPRLDRNSTWVLTLESLGSPRLGMLEGEGTVVMEDYHDRRFRDLIARVAGRAGLPLLRGLRARNSTDAVIPSRAGYPTATLISVDRHRALSHYHLPTDTPENIDYRTLQHALELTEMVAQELASNRWL